MRILNLYAGIGGNRKLWSNEHEITAIELDPKIASIYQDFFPNDKVIVTDAHEYLKEHYKEFDFIWSSPPCPSHSRIRNEAGVGRGQNEAIYPDMKLYEEIIFLKHFFKDKKWCVENVIAYYKPLIIPQRAFNHYFWTNFLIPTSANISRGHFDNIEGLQERKQMDLSKYAGIDKIKLLRNCVEPEVGKLILEYAINPVKTQGELNLN
jgi:DNA (cytosine-5)-methyltransferase 1